MIEHQVPPVAAGQSQATGRTITGQHCSECGNPDSTRQPHSGRVEPLATTPCCGALPCYGYVTTTPWIGQRTGQESWACCRGLAERAAGESVRLRLTEWEQ